MITVEEAHTRLWHLSVSELIAMCKSGEVPAEQREGGWFIARSWVDNLAAECSELRYEAVLADLALHKAQIAELTRRLALIEGALSAPEGKQRDLALYRPGMPAIADPRAAQRGQVEPFRPHGSLEPGQTP